VVKTVCRIVSLTLLTGCASAPPLPDPKPDVATIRLLSFPQVPYGIMREDVEDLLLQCRRAVLEDNARKREFIRSVK
jgi:hypothetical protein